jgi:hypothetical protein
VGPVLSQAHDPINFLGRRIVAPDNFAPFRREEDFPGGKHQTVGRAQGPEFHGRQRLLRHQIHHGQGVAVPAVVRNKRQFAVGGRHNLVRLVAGGRHPDHLERDGINNRQRMVALVENKQRGGRSVRANRDTSPEEMGQDNTKKRSGRANQFGVHKIETMVRTIRPGFPSAAPCGASGEHLDIKTRPFGIGYRPSRPPQKKGWTAGARSKRDRTARQRQREDHVRL